MDIEVFSFFSGLGFLDLGFEDSILLKTIKKLVKDAFWNDKLSRLKSVRMEDIEFISELFFVVLENKVLDSSPKVLDTLMIFRHELSRSSGSGPLQNAFLPPHHILRISRLLNSTL